MTVSVIVPVHNGASSVGDALASIQRQREIGLEILVHDDGSSDTTLALLRALSEGDPRLDISSGPNRGPAASRNLLLARARGDYVAFLDHDDLWPEGRLARQLALLESAPGAPGVLGRTILFEALDSDGQPRRSTRFRQVLCGLLQAGLFRRQAVARVGEFDPGLTVADDFDFLLRLIESAGPLLVDGDVAAWYRLHPGQRTADLELAAAGTARALARSLGRRRQASNVAAAVGWQRR